MRPSDAPHHEDLLLIVRRRADAPSRRMRPKPRTIYSPGLARTLATKVNLFFALAQEMPQERRLATSRPRSAPRCPPSVGRSRVKAFSTSRPMCPARACSPALRRSSSSPLTRRRSAPPRRLSRLITPRRPRCRATPTARRAPCARLLPSFMVSIPRASSAAQAPTSFSTCSRPPISAPAMRRFTASTASSFTRSPSSRAAPSLWSRRRPISPPMSMPSSRV